MSDNARLYLVGVVLILLGMFAGGMIFTPTETCAPYKHGVVCIKQGPNNSVHAYDPKEEQP